MIVYFLNTGLLIIVIPILLQQVQGYAYSITWVTILGLEAILVLVTAFVTIKRDTTDKVIY